MRLRPSIPSAAWSFALGILLSGSAALADQLILKSGREYSGKFMRGDASFVEFRSGGKVESFKTSEVAQIIFKEPELAVAPAPGTVQAPEARSQPPADQVQDQPPVRQVPPQPAGPTVTFPAETRITIRTTSAIDTERNRVGDYFTATLEDPITMGSQVILPRDAEVKGRITQAKESGHLTGRNELALELTEVVANGRSYTLKTGEYLEVGSSRGKRTAATVGGVSALGAVIGAIAGGGKGAAIGAVAGAAAGTGVQLITKGETLKVPAETLLEFKLQAPLTVTVP